MRELRNGRKNSMTESPRFSGIFCPNVVPLSADAGINEAELRRYVDWLIDRGVHGLYPNGSTGEFTRYNPEERRQIIEIVIDQCAGRVPVLAGAAEANVKETLAACEYYAKVGADAVAIVSPFYYRTGSEGVYAYFKEIGRNTPIDVTLYNIPMFASPIELDTAARLASECERIGAIKDSSGDVDFMQALIARVRPARPDWSFMTGWDSRLQEMLAIGCDGGTNATSGVAPEWTRGLFDAALAGRDAEASNLEERITDLFDTHFAISDFPDGFRLGVQARGIDASQGRMPLSDVQRAQVPGKLAKIGEHLKSAGLV